jgi:hypothetical protein
MHLITELDKISNKRVKTLKKTKLVIAIISVAIISSLLFAGLSTAKDENSPLAQLWYAIFGIQEDIDDLQTQVDELEVSAGSTRDVIEGSFDITQEGDLIHHHEYNITYNSEEYTNIDDIHWKRIDIPQLDLDNMPLVQVFVKTNFVSTEEDTEPVEMWQLYNPVQPVNNSAVMYDEGCVFIEFKIYSEGFSILDHQWHQDTLYRIDGNYKIVVVK